MNILKIAKKAGSWVLWLNSSGFWAGDGMGRVWNKTTRDKSWDSIFVGGAGPGTRQTHSRSASLPFVDPI